MDKKTQTIFPKMSEMFLALQLEVQAQLFILHHEYKCLASRTDNMFFNIILARHVSNRFNVTSDTTAALMTSIDKTTKFFLFSSLTRVSLGKQETRGNQSKCSKLKRQHLLSKDPVFVIPNPKHLMIIIRWKELANLDLTDTDYLKKRGRGRHELYRTRTY